MSNEVDKQVPGVPDGYRLVRIGSRRKGDMYLNGLSGSVTVAKSNETYNGYAIVEPIKPVDPPKPKTEDVVLNRYLVGVGVMRTVLVATAEYMDTYYYDYKLIGHSETIEVEVE